MSEATELSLLARKIAAESGSDLDFEGLEKVRTVVSRIGARWHEDTLKILNERNQPLLNKLNALESSLDSLLLISRKPAPLQKEFKARLEEYESVAGMCMDYAERHIGN